MSVSSATSNCLKCRWVQKAYRARANSYCLKHDMTIHDPLATFCAEFDQQAEGELDDQLKRLRLEDRQMYAWILMRPPPGPDGVSNYYYEHVHLTDIPTYKAWRADDALNAYRTRQREGQARLNQTSE